MTPREKALEAALREIISNMVPETKGDELFMHDLHKLLNQPEPEWLPTPLADPPGDAVIEDGDWVMTRSGCVLGPVHIYAGDVWWSELGWLPTGQYAQEGSSDLDITHVRKAVK